MTTDIEGTYLFAGSGVGSLIGAIVSSTILGTILGTIIMCSVGIVFTLVGILELLDLN